MPQLAFAFADFEMSNDDVPEDEMLLADELAALYAGEDMGPHAGMTVDELAEHVQNLD